MKKINIISDYVKTGIENGTLQIMEAVKGVSVTAKQGVSGQLVKTFIRSDAGSDFFETKNIVKKDKNGQPGWIVTNPEGERYIVKDEDFKAKYIQEDEGSNVYRPKGKPVLVAGVNEDVSFVAPWGEEMNIQADGFLVLAGKDDIYGIQGPAFAKTYMITETPSYEAEARARALLEMPPVSFRPSLDERITEANATLIALNKEQKPLNRNSDLSI